MKLHERIIDKHNKAEKLFKKRDDYALNNFIDKINISRELSNTVEKNAKNNKVKVQSRKNLIINTVTAIEVFIKDSIKGRFVYFSQENQQELLKERISLWEAHKLFRYNKIGTEDIIANYYSFQSLDSINKILSTLRGKDFIAEINKMKVELRGGMIDYYQKEELILKKDFPDWVKKVECLFQLRHESVHEINLSQRLGKKRTNDIIENLIAFTVVLDKYFWNTIDEFFRSKLD